MAWPKLSFAPDAVIEDFVPEVVTPIRQMAGKTIDAQSILAGVFLPGSVGESIAASYRKHLFGDATLNDLPDDFPRFVINARTCSRGHSGAS